MDRRTFLLGLGVVAAAGCARVPPPELSVPTGTAAAAAPLMLGSGVSPELDLLAELLRVALVASGRSAELTASGADWQAALGHDDLSLLPAFAATEWAGLSKESEPPAAADLVPDLASLLAPDVSVLNVPDVDGSLVWMVTQDAAYDGITSLSRIETWSKGRVAVVPELALERADGIPGLKAVYGANFEVQVVAEPERRATLVANGHAAIAAFRRTDYLGDTDLVGLVDVEKLTVADPAVVLVNSALTEAEPDQVLIVNQVAEAVTTEVLVDLQARVAQGGTAAEVASAWLKEKGLI